MNSDTNSNIITNSNTTSPDTTNLDLLEKRKSLKICLISMKGRELSLTAPQWKRKLLTVRKYLIEINTVFRYSDIEIENLMNDLESCKNDLTHNSVYLTFDIMFELYTL
jgi:hypothetical protein